MRERELEEAMMDLPETVGGVRVDAVGRDVRCTCERGHVWNRRRHSVLRILKKGGAMACPFCPKPLTPHQERLLMVLYAHQVAREKVEARSGVPVAAPSAYELQSFPEMRHGVVGTLDSLEQKGLIETRMGRIFDDKERDVWRARLQIHLTPEGESYIQEAAGYTT